MKICNSSNNNEKIIMNTDVGGESGGGPCGACKFLRRKCVEGCIFAPYFESSDQGTAHFAAVHRVFGASNASKLLLRIPPHSRLDAVITICYEALARVKDPVYGCVAHIFTLQQKVLNLQAELAYTQARIAKLQCPHSSSQEMVEAEDGDLHALARDYVSRYFPGVRLGD